MHHPPFSLFYFSKAYLWAAPTLTMRRTRICVLITGVATVPKTEKTLAPAPGREEYLLFRFSGPQVFGAAAYRAQAPPNREPALGLC